MCVLSEALRAHSIDATVFEPFVATELGGTNDAGMQTTDFFVTLQDIGAAGTRTHRLRIAWRGERGRRGRRPVQETVMTEWAACGIASAVLWHYTGLWVWTTADAGEGFDYWVKGAFDCLEWK